LAKSSAESFAKATAKTGKTYHRMWLNAPALISEREEHDTLARAEIFNSIAREQLEPLGWIELDWMNISLARAFDSTQGVRAPPTYQEAEFGWGTDGMHHQLNTYRMLVQVIANLLCNP
jgi:hypothetical protein